MCRRVQDEPCWRLQTTDSFGLLLRIFMEFQECRSGPTGFSGELNTHKAIIRGLGIGCAPVLIKGEKEQFLDWLSWVVESGAVKLPGETGSGHGPCLSLSETFMSAVRDSR